MIRRRRRLRAVAGLASAASVSLGTLAWAGTPAASPPAAGHRIVASGHSPATVPSTASNRRAALRDAQRLVRRVVPPAGAVLRSSGAAVGGHAHLLTAETASAVAYRTWSVADDPASVLSSVQKHLPPGSKLVSSGSGGPVLMKSVIRSWPPVDGVLDIRWLEIQVTSRGHGETRLYAESQSQWVVTRPAGERIPGDVRQVDLTDRWPGQRPFLSRRVTSIAKVHRLVRLFNSLGIVQPGSINCPNGLVSPTVQIEFRPSAGGRAVARASVSSSANFSWSPNLPGSGCFPIAFTARGRNWTPLVGNVIAPIQRLLHVKLAP